MIPITTFAGKTVAVFGLGGSGLSTVTALLAGGAEVAAWDDGAVGRAAAEKAGMPLVDLRAADWGEFAALVLAPGVPLTHPVPHWTVVKARAESTRRLDVGNIAGVDVIGDIELFCRERNTLAADAPFIAITGTNGKSTTTALIAHILREAGCDVQMGGNIGVPILALEPPVAGRYHVIEMSSFQIDLTPSLNPTVGVLLNLTPDHIDRHGTVENYAGVKYRLVVAAILKVLGMQAMLHFFPDAKPKFQALIDDQVGLVGNSRGTNVYAHGGMLRKGEDPRVVCNLGDVPTLRGAHNSENASAAFAALDGILDDATIARHLRTFPGLPHRMEEIGRVGDVLFINDSKATNADSTEKALASFPRDVFWILGGKPKEGGIESLRSYFPGVVKAYLIGAASDAFAATLDGQIVYERCGTLDAALAMAARDAAAYGPVDEAVADPVRQPVVLLSPACASYDQFANFEQRGDAFRALVTALPGFAARTHTHTRAPNA